MGVVQYGLQAYERYPAESSSSTEDFRFLFLLLTFLVVELDRLYDDSSRDIWQGVEQSPVEGMNDKSKE